MLSRAFASHHLSSRSHLTHPSLTPPLCSRQLVVALHLFTPPLPLDAPPPHDWLCPRHHRCTDVVTVDAQASLPSSELRLLPSSLVINLASSPSLFSSSSTSVAIVVVVVSPRAVAIVIIVVARRAIAIIVNFIARCAIAIVIIVVACPAVAIDAIILVVLIVARRAITIVVDVVICSTVAIVVIVSGERCASVITDADMVALRVEGANLMSH